MAAAFTTTHRSNRRLLCLAIMTVATMSFVKLVGGAQSQVQQPSDGISDSAPMAAALSAFMPAAGSSSRRLLRRGGSHDVLLAAGALGSIIQRETGLSEDDSPLSLHSRVLLRKRKDNDDDEDDDDDEEEEEGDEDDKDNDEEEEEEEEEGDKDEDQEDEDAEDDDDEDDEEEEDGGGFEISAMIGIHIKEMKVPKSLRRDEDEDEDNDGRRKKKAKGSSKHGKLLRDKNGELVMVETPVSPRFSKYLAKEPKFLDRIAYLGTIKRKELNAICKKVAKGKTNFKTDVNIDEVRGAEDTGDDIVGAKVDHQFGCTITKGPDVKLNPKLKKGVVFALLELGGSNNLIDCQAGQKKCHIWQLLDDEDVEELTDLYGNERRLQAAVARTGRYSVRRRLQAAASSSKPVVTAPAISPGASVLPAASPGKRAGAAATEAATPGKAKAAAARADYPLPAIEEEPDPRGLPSKTDERAVRAFCLNQAERVYYANDKSNVPVFAKSFIDMCVKLLMDPNVGDKARFDLFINLLRKEADKYVEDWKKGEAEIKALGKGKRP